MAPLDLAWKQLDMDEMRSLAHQQGPCVTIHVPDSHPGSAGPPRPAILRQLTQEAIERLGHLNRKPKAETLAAALKAFVATIEGEGGPGFTVFVAPGLETIFMTPGVHGEAIAAAHFDLLPVLAAAAAPRDFYALGLGRKAIRLWHVTAGGCEEIVLPHTVPSSLDHADHARHDIQNRSTVGHGSGKMNSMQFGTISDYDSEAAQLHHFFGLIAKGLKDVVHNAPLFLVGTRPDTLAFRRAAPTAILFESEWHENAAHCTAAQVEAEARLAAAREAYREAEAAAGMLPGIRDKIVDNADAILKAATEGRVQEVFVAEGARFAGAGENTLNAAVVETMRTGGRAFVLSGQTFAIGGSEAAAIAAVLRY